MTRTVDVHIGKKIKFLREVKKLSRSDLETAASLKTGLVAKFEDGLVIIKATDIFQIAKALETTVGFFYNDDAPEYAVTNMSDNSKITEGVSYHGEPKSLPKKTY